MGTLLFRKALGWMTARGVVADAFVRGRVVEVAVRRAGMMRLMNGRFLACATGGGGLGTDFPVADVTVASTFVFVDPFDGLADATGVCAGNENAIAKMNTQQNKQGQACSRVRLGTTVRDKIIEALGSGLAEIAGLEKF